MTLGVYWYFGFPTGLYEYDFFKFRKGLGGHAGNPAELVADVTVKNGELLVNELRELVNSHEDAFIFVYKLSNHLRIGTGGYMMHDFEFELALKIEEILKRNGAQLNSTNKLEKAELLKLTNDEKKYESRPTKKFFQFVGSPLRKSNAETASLRFDCNIPTRSKSEFLKELRNIAKLANINVIYYLDKRYENRYDLMLFFANGRQGRNLTPKQKIDFAQFEASLEKLIDGYDIQLGFIGYPTGKPKVLEIVDKEFIIE